jgi:hypothetical protein
MMRIFQMAARLFRCCRSRIVQQYAGDDLQTICDPMTNLLQQDMVCAGGFFFQRRVSPGVRDIRYGNEDTCLFKI